MSDNSQDEYNEQEYYHNNPESQSHDQQDLLEAFQQKIKGQQPFHRDSDQSDQENDYIQQPKQVRFENQKNEVNLAQKIDSIHKELAMQKKPKDEIEEVINSKNEGLKDKKIRELAQKNRQLFLQYEKEHQQKIKLEQQLKQLAVDTEENLRNLDKQRKNSASRQGPTDPLLQQLKSEQTKLPEIKTDDNNQQNVYELNKKLKEYDKKIQEQRVQIQTLKNDYNKAMRVLQKEIGDNVNVDNLLMDEQWKGRAQQIELLKGKIKDLQAKFSLKTGDSQFNEISSSKTENSKAAEAKRKELESLKLLVEQYRQENESLQQKMKAVNSRKLTLETEVKDLRAEFDRNKKILLEKSENDDKYIAALKAELEKMKKTLGQRKSESHSQIHQQSNISNNENLLKKDKGDNDEMSKLRFEIKFYRDELDRKEKVIKEILDTNTKLKLQIQDKPTSSYNINQEQQIQNLQMEVESLKKLNNEFFQNISQDQDTNKLIKDLSLQNAKLRNKIDDLQRQLK